MINYFKYTSGNAFTLSGVDYEGFVNIDDNKPFTGRVKNSFSAELSSKGNFLARSILDKREFDNSPTAVTTNKVEKLEYSPRNVLSNDFLKKNFNTLFNNNLSLYSLGQVYNSSILDTSNFKDEQTFGGFFGLSSTTIDSRNDDNNSLKNLNTPYQIDPFKSADESRFPGFPALDSAKTGYVETFEDGFLYTVTSADSETTAFSGCFSGQLERISNQAVQDGIANVKRLDVDKANGLIYSPTLESNGLTYTNMYDRDIYRACARLKLVDQIKTSDFRVINSNISFGKNYKVVQVIDNTNNIKLEISPNTTSEILATIPISSLDNAEFVRVESRYTDDLLIIVAKPLSNTRSYNAYFIDIPEFILNGVIPEPTVVPRVKLNSKYDKTTVEDVAMTVFGTSPLIPENENDDAPLVTGYWGPLFRNKDAASKFSLTTPTERMISIDRDGDGVYETDEIFYEGDLINFYGEDPVNDRPDGLFIYRGDDSIPDLDVAFSDYDSNLFTLTDNGNITERMVTNPVPVISYFDDLNLLLPPDILFNSQYKFNTNNWKFNTNSLKSNQISIRNILTDTFKDKTYVYLHNIGRIYYSTDSFNKKRISLVPADLESFFNPEVFDTICETSLGINLNVLIQDILRDTINIYNNFTRIPKAVELLSYYINDSEVSKEEYREFKNLPREEQLNRYGIPVITESTNVIVEGGVTSSTETVPSARGARGTRIYVPEFSGRVYNENESKLFMRTLVSYWGFVASVDSPNAILFPNQANAFWSTIELEDGSRELISLEEGIDERFPDRPRVNTRPHRSTLAKRTEERQLTFLLKTPVLNENQKFYITVSDYPEGKEGMRHRSFHRRDGAGRLLWDGIDLFTSPGELEQTEFGRLEVTAEELQEFLLLNTHQAVKDKYNDLVGRIGPTYYYINDQRVSRLEYEAFQNSSSSNPQVTTNASSNLTVSSRVEKNGVKVFDDYKIPPPLKIDTRNFYFHSNESVNYLSINRVFSKLFELQKTIYDSILSS